MNKALELADFLIKCVDEESSKFSSDDPFFIQAADELRRLSAIEQAATALIKCKGRYHAELNTTALAEAIGIELPHRNENALNMSKPLFWYRPYSNGEMCDGPIHDSVIEQVRKDSGVWIPLYDHPANQSSAEDLLVRALAALEYHTQQTRPIVESGNVITALMAYFAQSTERASQAVSLMAKTAPEVIWLQVSDNLHESALPFPANHADVTWCSESVMPSEVQYVRADLAGLAHGGLIPEGARIPISLNTGAEIYAADPRPSAIELQDAEVGIPEPVTELINAA